MDILSPVQQSDPTLISNFVGTVENLFQSEREQWMQQAIQSQQAIEQTLGKSAGSSQAVNSAPGGSDTTNQTTITTSILDEAEALTSVVSIQTPSGSSDNGTQPQFDVSVTTSGGNSPDNIKIVTTTAQAVPDTASNGSSASMEVPAVVATTPTDVSVTMPSDQAAPSSNGNADPVAVVVAAPNGSNGTNGASADMPADRHPADNGDGTAG